MTTQELLEYINTHIKANGKGEITGDMLGEVLTEVVNKIDDAESLKNAIIDVTELLGTELTWEQVTTLDVAAAIKYEGSYYPRNCCLPVGLTNKVAQSFNAEDVLEIFGRITYEVDGCVIDSSSAICITYYNDSQDPNRYFYKLEMLDI